MDAGGGVPRRDPSGQPPFHRPLPRSRLPRIGGKPVAQHRRLDAAATQTGKSGASKKSMAITIEDRPIGPKEASYLVAEIGLNYNGDLGLARETIDAAKDSGADAVKFQNYVTEDFISDHSLTHEYIENGKTVVRSQYEMFKAYELSESDLAALAEYCRECGIGFHSTLTYPEGVRLLANLGVGVLKNGSDYLTNLDLVRAMGETGLPTVLSTGMATVGEIDDAVRAFRQTGNDKLILLHCVSNYPCDPKDLNLRRIGTLQDCFNCPVGLSDHSEGAFAAALAVGLGACWIEKHFTLDKTLPGPDHRFSADPLEFKAMAEGVRIAEVALGSAQLGPTGSEEDARHGWRLSCVTARDLDANHKIERSDIAFNRPGTGLPPKGADWLVGRSIKTALTKGHVLSPEDLL
ncbi:MAG TPA: N-acetylneuraminate synthase [Kiloniellaceae bacterium]|nr:N-acetylneuraminate synthase [Kiloniellaceae bacterium]